jgi:hypothetical protein
MTLNHHQPTNTTAHVEATAFAAAVASPSRGGS